MKASKIREMTTQELHNELKKLKRELFNLRFQLATNPNENSRGKKNNCKNKNNNERKRT